MISGTFQGSQRGKEFKNRTLDKTQKIKPTVQKPKNGGPSILRQPAVTL